MDRDTWAAARALFEQVCELPAEQAETALENSSATVEVRRIARQMLRSERDGRSFALTDAMESVPVADLRTGLEERALLGQRLGPYRVVELVGRGGMGMVFRAVRDDGEFEQVVAIKFMGEGGNSRRFETEKQALGRLAHPQICRILDGGTHPDWGPFLVMEFVDGRPIDEYCREAGLGARACLRLMTEVIDAVGYAHGQLVLHRDLKPSNILVTRTGRPLVLDFGIAKILQSSFGSARTEQRSFTPRYAAPEQLANEPLGTPVDTFTLAVVLYELLSGAHPFIDGEQESDGDLIVRVLRGDGVPLRRALARAGSRAARIDLGASAAKDLEAVLEHAMLRDPTRSYQSAGAFADELRRVLDDRPVRVRAPTAIARMWRGMRRHWPLATGLALAAVSLLAGSGFAYFYALEAAGQRDLALASARRAESLSQVLTDAFASPNPGNSKGEPLSARDILDQSAKRIELDIGLRDDPVLAATLERALADTYRSIGAIEAAEALFERALARVQGNDAPELEGRLLGGLGQVRAYQANWSESESLARRAIELLESSDAPGPLIQNMCRLAATLINLQRLQEARGFLERGLTLASAEPRRFAGEWLVCASTLASIDLFEGRHVDAEKQYSRIIEMRKSDPRHAAGIGGAYSNLGAVRARMGRFGDAVASYELAVRELAAHLGSNNHMVAGARLGLAMALRGAGDFERAGREFSAAANLYRGWFGEDNRQSAYARVLHAEFLYLSGAAAEAEAALGSAPDVIERFDQTPSVDACRARIVRFGISMALRRPVAAEVDFNADQRCLAAEQAPPLARALAALVAAQRAVALGAADAPAAIARADQVVRAMPVSDSLLEQRITALRASRPQ